VAGRLNGRLARAFGGVLLLTARVSSLLPFLPKQRCSSMPILALTNTYVLPLTTCFLHSPAKRHRGWRSRGSGGWRWRRTTAPFLRATAEPPRCSAFAAITTPSLLAYTSLSNFCSAMPIRDDGGTAAVCSTCARRLCFCAPALYLPSALTYLFHCWLRQDGMAGRHGGTCRRAETWEVYLQE